MEKHPSEEALSRVVKLLNDKELSAYRYWQNSNLAPLAPATQAQLFGLFLNGKSCEEIMRLNPQFTLGQIVHARVIGQWDKRLQSHVDNLLSTTMSRVQQVTLESVNFVADLLSVANQLHGDRIRKYLQTGDESYLGELQITSLQGYGKAVELLRTLTGQDNQQKVSGRIDISHRAEPITATTVSTAPTSDEAGVFLKMLAKGMNEDEST